MDPLISCINEGKIAIIPTDTLYGIVGSALNPETVQKIYTIRKRNPDKPCIILISSLGDLSQLGIDLTPDEESLLQKIWPAPVSVVLPCPHPELEYLHRGTDTLAVRMPDDPLLREILAQTGPLIAPSANPEGQEPAHTIAEAKAYFGDEVDFYYDLGNLHGEPSTLITLTNGTITILRHGAGDKLLP